MSKLRRDLKLSTPAGTVTVPIVIFEPAHRARYWECRYEIGWPEGVSASEARGADSVQALLLAMQDIAIHLYASKHHKSGRLYWERPGQGYGLPMPKVGRGQLVGEDRLAEL